MATAKNYIDRKIILTPGLSMATATSIRLAPTVFITPSS